MQRVRRRWERELRGCWWWPGWRQAGLWEWEWKWLTYKWLGAQLRWLLGWLNVEAPGEFWKKIGNIIFHFFALVQGLSEFQWGHWIFSYGCCLFIFMMHIPSVSWYHCTCFSPSISWHSIFCFHLYSGLILSFSLIRCWSIQEAKFWAGRLGISTFFSPIF